MTALPARLRAIGPRLARLVAALFGGYALASLSSVAVLALPVDEAQAVIAGMLASFAVYAGAVIWVYAARSALHAWTGLALVAVPLLAAAWSVW